MESTSVTKSEFDNYDDRAEAERLVAALRDPAGWPRPSEGFAERCLERMSGSVPCHHPRRWLKIAASVAAMASFVGFAAYFAEKSGLLGGKEEEADYLAGV